MDHANTGEAYEDMQELYVLSLQLFCKSRIIPK